MDPLTGRWTSPDPIGEQGGMNLYVFVGNDGVDKNDVLGMWTDLKREGRPWATICAEKDDTWKGLADILHLETFEADKWIRNYDGPWPDSGKLYEVPNTFVVYTAKRPLWTGLSPLDVERMALFMFAYQAALGFKDVGYNVIEHYNADSKAVFESLWKSDGIMGIAFSGHGMPSWKTPNRITGYLSEPTTGRTSSPRTVGPPPYNLAVIMAFQCGGYEVGWQKYLSINKGTFIGFSGTITGIDIAFRAGNGKIVSEQMDDEPNP